MKNKSIFSSIYSEYAYEAYAIFIPFFVAILLLVVSASSITSNVDDLGVGVNQEVVNELSTSRQLSMW